MEVKKAQFAFVNEQDRARAAYAKKSFHFLCTGVYFLSPTQILAESEFFKKNFDKLFFQKLPRDRR